jgi:PAS domain S-box-containing protein
MTADGVPMGGDGVPTGVDGAPTGGDGGLTGDESPAGGGSPATAAGGLAGDESPVGGTWSPDAVGRAPGFLVATLDDTGTVRGVGPAVAEVLGVAPADLIGRRALVLVHPGDLPVVAGAAARVLAGVEVTGVRVRLARADGGWCPLVAAARRGGDGLVHVLCWAMPADDPPPRSGEPQVADGVDPGGALGAEDHETLVRALLDRMPVPLAAVDPGGVVRFANHELCRLLGVGSVQDVLGRTVTDDDRLGALVGEVSAIVAAASEAVGAPDGPEPPSWHDTVTIAGPDGARTLMVVRRAVLDDGGRALAVIALATDVSERLGSEERARERSQVLDAVLQASPDVISIVDRGGVVVRHNAHQAGYVDTPAVPLRLEDVLNLVHPEDLGALTAQYAAAMAGGRDAFSARYRLRHRDGRWVTVDSYIRIERDDDGRMVHMVAVTRDVGARQRADLVRQQALAAAEAADAALTEALERVSLAVRTPLDAVIGFAQLLELDGAEVLGAAGAAALRAVLDAGRSVQAMVDRAVGLVDTGHHAG